MRDILTGLALLLIVVLTAALAGPYFVDWTSQRPHFEERISAALGAPVTIAGPIDLVLLPTPHMRLGQVTVGQVTAGQASGGQAGAGPTLAAEEMDLEVAVMPLLRGDVRVTDARLKAPHVSLALTPAGGVVGLDGVLGGLAAAPGISIERLRIEDGVITVVDQGTGATSTLADIDAEADAQALIGPWRANGRAMLGDSPVELRLATGGPEAGGTRIKFVAQTYNGLQRGELDGRLSAGATGGGRFDGRLTVGGRLRWPDKDGYSYRPWSFVSALKVDGRTGKLDGAELEAGGDTSPVKFTGGGDVVFGREGSLTLTLEAKQIDLDRPYTQQGPTFVPLSAVVGGWLTALNQGDPGLPLPLPISANLKAGNIIIGGDTLAGVNLDLAAAGDGKLRIARMTAGLPGQATLEASGEARVNGGGQYNGRAQVRARDIGRLMGWLEGEPGGRSTRVADARDFSAVADVVLSPTVFAARNMRLTMDKSGVQGAVRYTAPEDAARGRFEAQLTSDGLAVEQVPDVSTLMAAGRGLDVAVVLDARNVRVGQASGPSVGAGRVGLKLAVNGDGIQIDTLDIADVGGASVKASGRVGEKGGRLDATIDARKVEPLAELLRKLVPGRLPALLTARAPVLGPLKLRLAAERGASPQEETRFTLEGTAAASRLDGIARIGGQQGLDKVVASFKVDAPDAAAFLSQLGFDALPLPGFGRGRLALDVEGRFGSGATLRIAGDVAGTSVSGSGQIGSTAEAPDYAGSLAIDSPDVGPLLQILALPGPDGLGRVPLALKSRAVANGGKLDLDGVEGAFSGAPFSGRLSLDGEAGKMGGALAFERLSLAGLAGLAIGTLPPPLPGSLWASTRFQPVMAPPYDASVSLTAKTLDLGYGPAATGFSGALHWSPEVVEVARAEAGFGGGRLNGGFSLRRQGGLATLSARMGLRGVPVAVLAPQSGIGGTVDADVDGAASGETPTALVGSLAGGGQLKLRDIVVPRLAPDALAQVTRRLDAEQDPPDIRKVRDQLAGALDQAPLVLGSLDTPLTLSNGQARIGPLATVLPGLDLSGSINFDLRGGKLDARASLVSKPAPDGWSGPLPQANVAWRSGRTGVEREVDVAALTNVLTTRAVSRELERIEAMESDLRERSFFVRRLKVERELAERERLAAEQARLAEEARKAEEARAAEEARRAEEARQLEEARKAEEARRLEEARKAEDARQAELARQEAARQEAARQEAARQEAVRQEAARQEAVRQEAARQDAARAAAEKAALDKAADDLAAKTAPLLVAPPAATTPPDGAAASGPPAAAEGSPAGISVPADDQQALEEAARIMGGTAPPLPRAAAGQPPRQAPAVGTPAAPKPQRQPLAP